MLYSDYDTSIRVRVFREHPAWDRHTKWFLMPPRLLNELHVATYDGVQLEDLDWIEARHPGHVYVY